MTDRKRVIITGISSSLMHSFVASIDLNKFEVIGLSRRPEDFTLPGVRIIKGDIRNSEVLGPLLKGCDLFIHGAAITHSLKEKIYYEINLEATKNLVDLASYHGVRRFVFISSRVAGEKSGAYGLSKLLAEQYIQENFENWCILRPSEIFGGDKAEGIDKLIHDALHKRVMTSPVGVRSKLFPLHLNDAALLMHKFGFQEEVRNSMHTLNGPVGYSYTDVIQMVGKIANRKIIIIPLPKILLVIAKWMVRIFSLRIGFVPDQVDRLYSEKEHETIDYNFFSLQDYVMQMINNRKGVYRRRPKNPLPD